ncbi:hypothetical protein A2160_02490 [Candidatus Beckwithbacteria bacterium RBG_13_42_9]|uniref:Uncharacterized protein n=1 Tax=Candidatus Beckwithbacteria bacterium RBG_13_42_9 TaxID=1797457 RepID=A0A1F5E7M9_9BACT|nr:MAG: hypothetical protein A2160_02490 [Candidatus Beckwithbacteria bacterium RBG_13_42_9]
MNCLLTNIEKSRQLAINWLLNSGIQNFDPKDEHLGGFNAWYDEKNDYYPFIYAEITGYLVNLHLFLYDQTKEKKYLERAILAGDWILRNQSYHSVIQCLFSVHQTIFNHKANYAYAFDNGIIINSLTNLYQISKDEKYLEAAKDVATWLINNLQKNNGSFYYAYDILKNRFYEDEERISWSTTSGSFIAKMAIGLLNLFDVTQKALFKRAALRLLNYSACFQREAGNFYSYPVYKGTHFHPHSYSLEAFLICGFYLNDQKMLGIAKKGIFWNFSHQKRNGAFPRKWHQGKFIYRERIDILAQNLRLGILARYLGFFDEANFDPKLERTAKRLLSFQSGHKNIKAYGGFNFDGNQKKRLNHVNVWVTAFAIQALIYYLLWQRKQLTLAPFLFV